MGHCEIDRYANASYRAIRTIGKEEKYYPDAKEIDPDSLPDFDLLYGGFPCQTFSHAGRRKDFADARGALFFEIARLTQVRQSPYLLLENVPELLSHDKGRTFQYNGAGKMYHGKLRQVRSVQPERRKVRYPADKSIKNVDTAEKGYGAHKKVSGIKLHIMTDTMGLSHAISCANITDRKGAADCRTFFLWAGKI